MTLNFANFSAWQNETARLAEARTWLAHNGKQGRGSDILRLSPAHCSAPQFTFAGQYSEGGKNYWESPKEFNQAMQTVILRRFSELAEEAIGLLEKQTAASLVKAEGEVASVQAAIAEAKGFGLS